MSEVESLVNQVIYQAFRIGYASAKNNSGDFSSGNNIPIRSKPDLLLAIKRRIKGEKGDIQKPKHSHYHKDVSDYDTIDIYAVCKIFDVQDTSGCLQHAIKKLLVTGKRGHKDRQTDIQNAVDTLNRLLELESE